MSQNLEFGDQRLIRDDLKPLVERTAFTNNQATNIGAKRLRTYDSNGMATDLELATPQSTLKRPKLQGEPQQALVCGQSSISSQATTTTTPIQQQVIQSQTGKQTAQIQLTESQFSVSESSNFTKKIPVQQLNRVDACLKLMSMLADEFNCNHQQDLQMGSELCSQVFGREAEEAKIIQFLNENMQNNKSGLMYLCGQPGTGKTSLLNQVLHNLQRQQSNFQASSNGNSFDLYLYNANTFFDVKMFAVKLLKDLTSNNDANSKLSKQSSADLRRLDDETLAKYVAQALIKDTSSNSSNQCIESKKHTILVIDEVDSFSSHEAKFTLLVKKILSRESKTSCSLIGIANAVDLPFRKKHSAIAMRDVQLLFKPYEKDDIVDVLETKKNVLQHSQKVKKILFQANQEDSLWLKQRYQQLIEPKVYEFIGKKVSQLNGDIRAAFDMMRNGILYLMKQVQKANGLNSSDVLQDQSFKLTLESMLKLHEEKNGSKVASILSKTSRAQQMILHAVVCLFGEVGEDKSVKFLRLWQETQLEAEARGSGGVGAGSGKMTLQEFNTVFQEIENYSLLKVVEQNRKDYRMSKVALGCDLEELGKELKRFDQQF